MQPARRRTLSQQVNYTYKLKSSTVWGVNFFLKTRQKFPAGGRTDEWGPFRLEPTQAGTLAAASYASTSQESLTGVASIRSSLKITTK